MSLHSESFSEQLGTTRSRIQAPVRRFCFAAARSIMTSPGSAIEPALQRLRSFVLSNTIRSRWPRSTLYLVTSSKRGKSDGYRKSRQIWEPGRSWSRAFEAYCDLASRSHTWDVRQARVQQLARTPSTKWRRT